MKCHEKDKNKKHNPMKHMVMMILCCGLPIMIVGILPFINIGGGFKAAIIGITPFLCPLMMLFMIPMMFKGMKGGECCKSKKEDNIEQI